MKNLWLRWKSMKLPVRIGIAFILGVIAGFAFGPQASVVKPIGTLFIRLLQMLVYPLVFFTLVTGMASINDTRKMARVGGKTIVYYIFTTAAAIIIGLVFANVFKPGAGVDLGIPVAEIAVNEPPSIVETLLNFVPTNPFSALAQGQILAIITFSIFVGLSIVMMKNEDFKKKATEAFEIASDIMFKMTEMVIAFAPFGVFALIADVVGKHGMDVLIPLAKVTIVFHLAILTHIILVQGLILLKFKAKVSPIRFMKGFASALVLAYATDSSNATLPESMRCAQQNLGISKSISSFVQPLGATINMDGSALYQGIIALFVAQILGIDLSLNVQIMILFTALLASIGTAGVPGASLIMLSMTLTAAGLPLEGVAIVAGIDRILGGARILPNVIGDAVVALIIAKDEGEFDESIFYSNNEKIVVEA